MILAFSWKATLGMFQWKGGTTDLQLGCEQNALLDNCWHVDTQ